MMRGIVEAIDEKVEEEGVESIEKLMNLVVVRPEPLEKEVESGEIFVV